MTPSPDTSPDGGGRDNEERPVLPVVGSNPQGLDSLAQTHVVSNQHFALPTNTKSGGKENVETTDRKSNSSEGKNRVTTSCSRKKSMSKAKTTGKPPFIYKISKKGKNRMHQ